MNVTQYVTCNIIHYNIVLFSNNYNSNGIRILFHFIISSFYFQMKHMWDVKKKNISQLWYEFNYAIKASTL